jgi:RecB family exonuclease
MAFHRMHSSTLKDSVGSVSPSLAANLERCPLAVVFAHDPDFRDLTHRSNHFAALGEICHALWEREGRGEFDAIEPASLPAALNAAWAETESRVVDALRNSLNGAEPPAPRQWPDYLAKRLGVLSLIRRSVEARRSRGPSNGRRPLIEDAMRAPEGRLQGRPDRVIWRDGVPHIVDLKTCKAPEQIDPEHRRQLLAYAYLFHARYDLWPATASIQYVGGEMKTIVVEPEEAGRVVGEMLDALTALNSVGGDFEALARPSPDACRWCSYKAACAPFFAMVRPEWDLRDRHVLGTVEEIDLEAARPCFTLAVSAGNVDVEGERIVVVVPDAIALDGIAVGQDVAVTGAGETRSPSTIRCDWDTLLCVWDREPVGAHASHLDSAV